MEAKRIEVSEFLRACHGKSDIVTLSASSLYLRLQHQAYKMIAKLSILFDRKTLNSMLL